MKQCEVVIIRDVVVKHIRAVKIKEKTVSNNWRMQLGRASYVMRVGMDWNHRCMQVLEFTQLGEFGVPGKNARTAWRLSVCRQAPYQSAGFGVLSAFW